VPVKMKKFSHWVLVARLRLWGSIHARTCTLDPLEELPKASTKAIVWLIDAGNASSGGNANLWAFDGATLDCLFTTDSKATSCTRISSADVPAGIAVKFTVPSVANGKVYVGTAGGSATSGGYLNIYGLSD